jgi:hypothetical protein
MQVLVEISANEWLGTAEPAGEKSIGGSAPKTSYRSVGAQRFFSLFHMKTGKTPFFG